MQCFQGRSHCENTFSVFLSKIFVHSVCQGLVPKEVVRTLGRLNPARETCWTPCLRVMSRPMQILTHSCKAKAQSKSLEIECLQPHQDSAHEIPPLCFLAVLYEIFSLTTASLFYAFSWTGTCRSAMSAWTQACSWNVTAPVFAPGTLHASPQGRDLQQPTQQQTWTYLQLLLR